MSDTVAVAIIGAVGSAVSLGGSAIVVAFVNRGATARTTQLAGIIDKLEQFEKRLQGFEQQLVDFFPAHRSFRRQR